MATYPTFAWYKASGGSGGVGPFLPAYSVNAATANAVLTAAEVLGPAGTAPAPFKALRMTGTLAAGRNAQLPTVASLIAAFGLSGGGSFGGVLRVINASSANFAWTVTTNTGWTLGGTMTVAQNTFRDFLVTVDANAGTATLQSIGTGTDS